MSAVICGYYEYNNLISIRRGGIVSGVESYFTLNSLLKLNIPPSYNRAKEKKGPVRCGFQVMQ